MRQPFTGFGFLFLMGAALAVAQPGVPAAPMAPPAGAPPQAPRAPQAAPAPAMVPQPPQPPKLFRDHRPPMERALRAPAPGRWWHDPNLVQRLGLTTDQQKKMDDIFQQHRLRLIDLNAALEKEETIMEPLAKLMTWDEKQ